MDSDHEGDEVSTGGLFADPEGFYPASPPPTTQEYVRKTNGAVITLHLVGSSPSLEANHLWNGSRVMAEHFEDHPEEVRGRTVLEIGAGAGLPSIVAAALDARKVVVTDYPDPEIVATMWKNIRGCPDLISDDETGELKPIVADGYIWGADAAPLLAHLDDSVGEEKKFDVVILADLLFRHSGHTSMVNTIEKTLSKRRGSKAFVVFSSYRPWLRHKDLVFFDIAREHGFVVEKILERKMDRPLFKDDPGDVEVLKTVTGWEIRWPEEVAEE
ncbi:hypothetical protein B0H63DRAFT_396315 [Podospora didyma]|uniref:Protein N-terminal and lysine N-methyltransferase EFM7 n=1 Tax=Podospora didyma TaxID=330526 RepID=A0AAE0TW01_9PEZI|nr:hypothetical protein B0H63DRAFT_396315 [Podospora didyma]